MSILRSLGALDYLQKPVKQARLAESVSRFKDRLQSSRPAINTEQLPRRLSEQLDPLDAEQLAQVHRSVVVNLRAVSHVECHDNETAQIHLKGRGDVFQVSRNYLHLFRQM